MHHVQQHSSCLHPHNLSKQGDIIICNTRLSHTENGLKLSIISEWTFTNQCIYYTKIYCLLSCYKNPVIPKINHTDKTSYNKRKHIILTFISHLLFRIVLNKITKNNSSQEFLAFSRLVFPLSYKHVLS